MLISGRIYNVCIFLQHGKLSTRTLHGKYLNAIRFTKIKKDMLIIYDHLPINNHIMQGLQAMPEKMHHGSVLVELHTGWRMTRSLYL